MFFQSQKKELGFVAKVINEAFSWAVNSEAVSSDSNYQPSTTIPETIEI